MYTELHLQDCSKNVARPKVNRIQQYCETTSLINAFLCSLSVTVTVALAAEVTTKTRMSSHVETHT